MPRPFAWRRLLLLSTLFALGIADPFRDWHRHPPVTGLNGRLLNMRKGRRVGRSALAHRSALADRDVRLRCTHAGGGLHTRTGLPHIQPAAVGRDATQTGHLTSAEGWQRQHAPRARRRNAYRGFREPRDGEVDSPRRADTPPPRRDRC